MAEIKDKDFSFVKMAKVLESNLRETQGYLVQVFEKELLGDAKTRLQLTKRMSDGFMEKDDPSISMEHLSLFSVILYVLECNSVAVATPLESILALSH